MNISFSDLLRKVRDSIDVTVASGRSGEGATLSSRTIIIIYGLSLNLFSTKVLVFSLQPPCQSSEGTIGEHSQRTLSKITLDLQSIGVSPDLQR